MFPHINGYVDRIKNAMRLGPWFNSCGYHAKIMLILVGAEAAKKIQ
jgi:hypothetical protein